MDRTRRFWGIVVAGFVLTIGSTPRAKYSGGTGEPNNPYQLATTADLIALGNEPNDYNRCFILTADIDLDPNLPDGKVFGAAVIAPSIDSLYGSFQGTCFTGIFDGAGHKISHLTIIGASHLGLFGRLGYGASVSDLDLEAVEIRGTGWYFGGLVGHNKYGSIVATHSTGSVHGDSNVGGLVGCNEYGSIEASHIHGSSVVNGTGWGVGGLAGSNYYGRIAASYSTSAVGGTGWGAGGLVGHNEGNITASYAAGSVSGRYYVGGLVGDNEGYVITSYSTGSVIAEHDYVGGLVGENEGNIVMSYSSGPVCGVFDVGGLVGTESFSGIENQSFWDVGTSGQTTSDGGTGLTTTEMQTADTFLAAGWDFIGETANGTEEIWWIPEGKNYPSLWWELIPED